jgi:hypothetical protein
VQRDLARALIRRHEAARLNARALDAIAPFPGAALFSQDDNAEGTASVPGNCEYENALIDLPADAFTTLAAKGWGTFRTYRLARPMRSSLVYSFVVTRLRRQGWVAKRVQAWGEPSPHGFEAYFRKGPRCLWILAGLKVSPLPGSESYAVATDAGPAAAC